VVKSANELLKKGLARLREIETDEIRPGSLPAYFRAASVVAEARLKSEVESFAIDELLKVLNEKM